MENWTLTYFKNSATSKPEDGTSTGVPTMRKRRRFRQYLKNGELRSLTFLKIRSETLIVRSGLLLASLVQTRLQVATCRTW